MRLRSRKAAAGKRTHALRYVYYFGDGHADGKGTMKALLGGKGANLHEMTRIGLPVPPGFTINTEVCSYFYDHNRSYPPQLEAQVAAAMTKVEKSTSSMRYLRRQISCSVEFRGSASPNAGALGRLSDTDEDLRSSWLGGCGGASVASSAGVPRLLVTSDAWADAIPASEKCPDRGQLALAPGALPQRASAHGGGGRSRHSP